MKQEQRKKLLLFYMHENRWHICFYFLCIIILFIVSYLYHVPIEPVVYVVVLTTYLGLILGLIRFLDYSRKKRKLCSLQNAIEIGINHLPKPDNYTEEIFHELLTTLDREKTDQLTQSDKRISEFMEYFTMWVHQIKTPIAAMDLLIQNNRDRIQTENYQHWSELDGELFKIQQYVDMLLQYFRLNDTVSDFVLKQYELDPIIKQALHKYAPLFIRKKIKLCFTETQATVITDEKWLVFVLEQLLSNAIKYTKSGRISIYTEDSEKSCLVIEDTGIGILMEDLPRVFEQGYTGYNGRKDKKATGIGLYLCRLVLNKLSHKIWIESEVGKGTKVRIDLSNGFEERKIYD